MILFYQDLANIHMHTHAHTCVLKNLYGESGPWKSRLGDYGAIQVSAGYWGREQLPLQQTDVCAQETATPRIHVETAHSGRRAPASLLERIQFERLQRRYDGSCWRRRWGLKTGVRAARVRPLIRSFRSSSVPIFSKKNKWIFEDTRTFYRSSLLDASFDGRVNHCLL